MFSAPSELSRHCEQITTALDGDDDDAWLVAGENESVTSFLTRWPPSFMDKAWISAQHDGLTKAIEEYYEAAGVDRESALDAIKAAWEEAETKSLETLTETLKEHSYGGGKWMLFVTADVVDAVWRKVVTALWDGKLGPSAKVSGNTPECNGSHVIYVYVDPFWDVGEVERVLVALREECGVSDAIKFKADGVTQLGLSKGNAHGIPPSFYAANRNATSVVTQKASAPGSEKWERKPRGEGDKGGEGGKGGAKDDKWTRSNKEWVRREARAPASRGVPPPTEAKPKVKPPSSVFAALMGVGEDDADAILAKAEAKKEKKKKKKKEEAEAAEGEVASMLAARFAGGGGGLAAWGDEDDDEEEAADEEEDDEESDEEEEEEEEEAEEAEEAAAGGAAAVPDVSDAPPAEAKPVEAKAKTAEELEVEALLASLEGPGDKADAAGGEAGGMSKSAAKRAKKKAAAAKGGEGSGAAEGGAAEEGKEGGEEASRDVAEDDGENADENGAFKSAADIKKMMAAKAAAAKKKGGSSSAAEAAAKEAKLRAAADGGKKKKGGQHWESGGKSRGQKARGSDNKYQGE